MSMRSAASDSSAIVAAAQQWLDLQPRSMRYASLSFCALDAVFSINADYRSTTIHVPERYAAWAGLEPLWVKVAETAVEQDLRDFVADVERVGVEEFAANVLRNQQLTSTRARVRTLKAEAALDYARLLVEAGANTFAALSEVESSEERSAQLRAALARVPGHGGGARLSYFFMLAGDDFRVKPDRMIHRFVARELGRELTNREAEQVLAEAASELRVTPWVLDHAIWTFETTPLGGRG